VEGPSAASQHLSTASLIESAARELGKRFEIERGVRDAAHGRTSNVPKPAADACAAVAWKDVKNIDLDAPRNLLLTRRTAADETHYLVCDRGDHVQSLCSLQ
jgi:hypothetical protein